jgi:hypothetical protein
MNIDIIKTFKNKLCNLLKKINNDVKCRNSKIIQFRDIIYYSSLIVGNNESYDVVNSKLKICNLLNVSKNTLVKQRNKLNYDCINQLNDGLLTHIYDLGKKRIIGVDGTYINLLKSLNKYEFTISRNKNYCIALLSTLFDVEKEIPINYYLSKTRDERNSLIKQLKYVRPNDILIMDRGYFSKYLLTKLTMCNIKLIFRLRKNLKILKNLKNSTDYITNISYNKKFIQFRLIKYVVNNKIYYLGTTIYNKSISYLKNLYWKRWKTEIHFKYSKYNLSLKELNSKTENTVRQDILINQFIFIISSYFQYVLQIDIKKNYKINTTNHLNITINQLLYLLFYKKSTINNINEIIRILSISKQVIVSVKNNISYERIKKRPSSKWCQYGNKFKMNH